MNLLMLHEENKSHYVYIKDFNRLVLSKTKNKNKKHFAVVKIFWLNIKKIV